MATCLAATLLATSTHAYEPEEFLPRGSYHRVLNADMPPGFVGQARLAGRGAVAGYFQPVAISGPEGSRYALPNGGSLADSSPRLTAGLLIGAVYRFKITGIPGAEGAELFPTVEVIDRTCPPPGLATKFPIEIQLDEDDFAAALGGQLVTRVIYLEDPQTAVPQVQTPETNQPYDIAEYQDALEVADRLGRPVAIVRIGSLAPPNAPELLPQFFFGYPNWAPIYQPDTIASPSDQVPGMPMPLGTAPGVAAPGIPAPGIPTTGIPTPGASGSQPTAVPPQGINVPTEPASR